MILFSEIVVRPIGFVSTEAGPEDLRLGSGLVSRIVLREEFSDSLEGIDEYSHIYIIYWMHLIDEESRSRLKVHPRDREDLPLVGVLAARGHTRINPVGLTVVELVERKGNVLLVRGLDAVDGTPVIDVKPYDYYDVKENIRVPEWFEKIWRERIH